MAPPSSWDSKEIFPLTGSVVLEENVYKMWYGGYGLATAKYNIGYAISTDGSIWTKDTINNPVLQEGPSSAWDGAHVVPGSVINDGSVYRMWYSGCGDDFRYRIGLATSADGIVWTKDTVNNPVLSYGAQGSWDYNRVVGASVLWNNAEEYYMMWYSGGNWYFGRTGCAISQATGIVDPEIQHSTLNIQSYPNPTRGVVDFRFSIFDFRWVSIKIYEIHGREVMAVLENKLPAGEHVVRYDMTGWPEGVYFVRVQAGQEEEVRKIVKIN